MTTPIAICGLPRSGNRIIRKMLIAHGIDADVRHFGNVKHFRTGGVAPERAILPVRDVRCHWLSCKRDGDLLPNPIDYRGPSVYDDAAPARAHLEHWTRTIRFLASHNVPALPVVYEEIIADPETQGRRILEFALPGAKWKGWGFELHDGNAKWEGFE